MKKGEPFIVQDTAGRYSARGGGYTKDLQKAGVMREDSGSWSKEYWRIIPVVVTIKVKK